jgi:hypothetical protein
MPDDAARLSVDVLIVQRPAGVRLPHPGWRPRLQHELYEAPLALIRPDQVVAWRGDPDTEATAVIPLISGQRGDQ